MELSALLCVSQFEWLSVRVAFLPAAEARRKAYKFGCWPINCVLDCQYARWRTIRLVEWVFDPSPLLVQWFCFHLPRKVIPGKGPFFHFILLLHPVDFPHPCRITTFDLMSEEVAKEMETKLWWLFLYGKRGREISTRWNCCSFSGQAQASILLHCTQTIWQWIWSSIWHIIMRHSTPRSLIFRKTNYPPQSVIP